MTDLWRIPDFWRRLDVTVRDLPLALVLVVASFLPFLHGHATEVGDLPARPFDALAAVLIGVECFPLALRRRWPAASLVLVVAAFMVSELLSYHLVAGTALTFMLISAGAHLERHRHATVVVLSLAYVVLVVALVRLGAPEGPGGYATFYVETIVAWGIGSWVRATRSAEAEHRRRVAEATRAAERSRIARDLHDVVTHHVTAMVVQAEAARYLTAAPDRLDEAFGSITDTGRRAITDLRHLLDLLDPDTGSGAGGQAPHTGEIHTLVEQTRRAGQPVELTEEGRAAEPARGAEVVAYRVVQEALTNALKYAHGSRTAVRARYGEKEIAVEVRTDGPGSRSRSPGGGGRGLAGLRRRVESLGGEFRTDRPDNGGYVVRARIPADSSS